MPAIPRACRSVADTGEVDRDGNIRHFPNEILATFGLEARSADDFIADTIALDVGRAVPAVRVMRLRLRKPAIDAERLVPDMEARGLTATADMLAPHMGSF